MKKVKDYPPYLDYPKPRKIQTNADKIRAMTDPELAKRLNKLTDSYPGVCLELPECHADLDADRDIPLERCEACWIRWLRQPAEGSCASR